MKFETYCDNDSLIDQTTQAPLSCFQPGLPFGLFVVFSAHTGQLLMPSFSALLRPLQFLIFCVLRISVLQLFVLFGFLSGFQFPFLVTRGKKSRRENEARTRLTPFRRLCFV